MEKFYELVEILFLIEVFSTHPYIPILICVFSLAFELIPILELIRTDLKLTVGGIQSVFKNTVLLNTVANLIALQVHRIGSLTPMNLAICYSLFSFKLFVAANQ